MAEASELLTLTADIVSAHVSNNSVAVNDLPNLVRQVHDALTQLGQPAADQGPAKREPRVSIRSSVKHDAITCLLCGKKQKTLKRHLMTTHQMTAAEYREEFGLKADYPLVAPEYAETRRTLAKSIGLGTKRRRGDAGAAAPKSGGRSRKPKTPASEG